MNICQHCKLFLKELFIFTLSLYTILFLYPIPWYVIFIISAIPIIVSYSTISSFFNLLNIIIPITIFSFFTDNIFSLYIPFITYFLITLSLRSGRIWAYIITLLYVILWITLSIIISINIADIILILSSLLMIVFSLPMIKGKGASVKNIDVIYSSNTGNTLKIAKKFATGVYDTTNGDISISDINSYNFKNEFRQYDGVVIAFPVHLFGPGRSFLYKIMKQLPKGNNKNAFILYSGSMYDDMSSIILWLILTFKGYSVKGKLFSSSLLQRISFLEDKINNSENNIIYEAGGDFADGWYCGEPLLVIPSPLFLLTLLKK